MWKHKTLLIAVVILSAILFTSCQDEPNPIESSQDFDQSGLAKFTLPAGATFVSATFNVLVVVHSSQNINVHRITSPWEELEVTWNNFGGAYSPTVEGTFNADAVGWHSVDVTGLVGGWLDDSYSNYGLLIDQVGETYPRTVYDTRELDFGPNPAYLEICYSLDGDVLCDTTRTIGDTWIHEVTPDENNGWKGLMYSGYADQWDMQKRVLFMFDLESDAPPGECTNPPIYWKKHTQYGPGLRNTNWDLIQPNGENTPFFSSGDNYYEILSTSPLVSVYYFLASQYIAAQLNILSGASVPGELQTAFDDANILLNTYTPEEVSTWGFFHPTRRQFRRNAFELFKYNWGLKGPGKCDSCGH